MEMRPPPLWRRPLNHQEVAMGKWTKDDWRCDDCGVGGQDCGVPDTCPSCGSPNTRPDEPIKLAGLGEEQEG